MSTRRVLLSVVFPTRDRSAMLSKALESVTRQTLPPADFEVVVVDNGSSDNTATVCAAFEARFENFRYVLEPRPGLHAGRHAGYRCAHGDILVYADDDITASPTWLSSIVEAFEDEDVGLVGGRILPEFEAEPPGWIARLWRRTANGRYLSHFSVLDFGDEVLEIDARFVWGCNFSIRRGLVERAGGFHPDAFPRDLIRFRGDGETALALAVSALGFKSIYHPGAAVTHYLPRARMSADYLRRRGFAQGVSDSYSATRQGAATLGRLRVTAAMLKHRLQQTARRWLDGTGLEFAEYCAGYREGFKYHQAELVRDPALLAWVNREHYFEP